MAKEAAATSAAPEQDVDREIPLTLDEFCARLSKTDRRVEMIGAFHYVERVAGRVKDLETAFRVRFDAFCNKPA